MTTIEQRYYDLHRKSAAMAATAGDLFPDGVTHDARRLAPFPIYMDRGKGPRKWDIDGNEYIDYRTGHGSMILGQAHPAVVRAVQEQVARGTHLSASTELEIQWAQAVKRLVPSVEKLRFVSSGTEAIMMAFKMARAFTGRQKIVKFATAFHGWSDYAFALDPERDRKYGIPDAIRDTMVILPHNDLDSVESALESDRDIAAVIFQGNEIVRPEYLEGLRDATSRHNVLLIIDEVVSGFRWSRAGCQGRYGITPDLSAFAKILAGGLPGGMVGGRADVIDTIKSGGIAHPGTFNANPLSAAAGVAALSVVENEPINEAADAMAARLKEGINDVLQRMELPGGAYGLSSVVHVSIGKPVNGTDEYATLDRADQGGRPFSDATSDLLHLAFVNEGVWSRPTSYILSATHTSEDIQLTVDRFETALKEVRKTGAI